MRTRIVTAIVTVLVAVTIISVIRYRRTRAYRPAEFSFAVLGDAPYEANEEARFQSVLKALDANELAFVIHVGDIFWRPCTDAAYKETLARFNGVAHAVVNTPGDNEWADCWEDEIGAMVPLDRLASLRAIFFSDPTYSLGKKKIDLLNFTRVQVPGSPTVGWVRVTAKPASKASIVFNVSIVP